MRPASPPFDAARFEIRADPRPLTERVPPSPAPRRPPAGAVRPRLLRTAAASTLIIGILVALAREETATGAGRASGAAPTAAPSSPSWAAAAPLYTLDGEPFTARTHPKLGREDAFTLGAFREDAPYLRLVLPHRPTSRPPFFVDIARTAAADGIGVVRIGRASEVETAFGPAEIADAVLATSGAAGASGEAGGRACLAFRFGEIGFVGAGWLCGAAERPGRSARIATGEHLACLLDRLDLVPAAPDAPAIVDPALRRLFAGARRGLARCEPPHAVGEPEPAPARIPAELFSTAVMSGATGAEADRAEPRKLGRSRRRERS